MRNRLRGNLGQEGDEQPQTDKQRDPAGSKGRHMQLGVEFAVGIVVVNRMRGGETGGFESSSGLPVLAFVGGIVETLSGARTEGGKTEEQDDCQEPLHRREE